MDLNTLWFWLIGLLFTGYAILDGFDLGVGALHLFTKKDQDRRILLNSIGPLWDGNEVWLLTGGGALFAAFPMVYATVFSGFYTAMFILLFALIFRAISIEFRSKIDHPLWTKTWDLSFSIGSIVALLILGVALGNIIRGIPLSANYEFQGSLLTLLNPYALLIGVMTVVLMMLHGSLYLILKTEGHLQVLAQKWYKKTYVAFFFLFIIGTIATFTLDRKMNAPMVRFPILWIIPIVSLLSILSILVENRKKNYFRSFLSSCFLIISLMILFGLGIFPNLVLSFPDTQSSLNIYNGASSGKTLKNMLVITIIGFPLVLIYTSYIYWIFRGKVKLDKDSY